MRTPLTAAHPTLLKSAIVAVFLLWALRDLALLVGYAVVLAYALLPLVRALGRIPMRAGVRMPKHLAAAAVVLALVSVTLWAAALVVPRLTSEFAHFAANTPAIMARWAAELDAYAVGHALGDWFEPLIGRMRAQGPTEPTVLMGQIMNAVGARPAAAGGVLCLTLLPLLAFYLLADADAVKNSVMSFIPEEARAEIATVGGAVDRALRSYIRGQSVVCLMTGVLVMIGLALLHHPAAVLLGVIAGAAELIPYLGFTITVLAIALAGSAVGTFQAVAGVAFYMVLNWSIGTFVTPRLMGRYLKMHPFVITVSVLAGADLFGPAGALLALPAAAVFQAIIGTLAPATAPVEVMWASAPPVPSRVASPSKPPTA